MRVTAEGPLNLDSEANPFFGEFLHPAWRLISGPQEMVAVKKWLLEPSC